MQEQHGRSVGMQTSCWVCLRGKMSYQDVWSGSLRVGSYLLELGSLENNLAVCSNLCWRDPPACPWVSCIMIFIFTAKYCPCNARLCNAEADRLFARITVLQGPHLWLSERTILWCSLHNSGTKRPQAKNGITPLCRPFAGLLLLL